MMIIIKDANYKTVTIKGGNSYCLAKKEEVDKCVREQWQKCVCPSVFLLKSLRKTRLCLFFKTKQTTQQIPLFVKAITSKR